MKTLSYVQAEVRATLEPDSRTVEFVISDGSRDRYATRILPTAWRLDSYQKNPVVSYNHSVQNHDAGPADIIGTSRVWLEGDKLIGAVRFEPADVNPYAEEIYRKVLHGSLRAASVGFIPHAGQWGAASEARGAENETFIYTDVELLEWSVVGIPGNANAVRRSFALETKANLVEVCSSLGITLQEARAMTVGRFLDTLEGKVAPEGVTPVTLAEPAAQTPDFRTALREALYGTPQEQLRTSLRSALA